MEKLIELLNKYEAKLEDMPLTRQRWRSYNGELVRRFMVNKDAERMIISKSFGFIKWLVENNKIDIERLHKIVDYRLEIKENYVNAHDYNSDCLLMILSISDTPISDLISYLK